jgi:hypothetical protein
LFVIEKKDHASQRFIKRTLIVDALANRCVFVCKRWTWWRQWLYCGDESLCVAHFGDKTHSFGVEYFGVWNFILLLLS